MQSSEGVVISQEQQPTQLVKDTDPARAVTTTAAGSMDARLDRGHGVPSRNIARDARHALVRRLR